MSGALDELSRFVARWGDDAQRAVHHLRTNFPEIPEQEYPHYVRKMLESAGEQLRTSLDPATLRAVENAERLAGESGWSAAHLARASGGRVTQPTAGGVRFEIEGQPVADFPTATELQQFLLKSGHDLSGLNHTASDVPGLNSMTSVPGNPQVPPMLGETPPVSTFRRTGRGLRGLFMGAYWSARENWFKDADLRFPGMYQYFLRFQDAVKRSAIEITRVKRPMLKDTTFEGHLEGSYRLLRKIPRERWPLITDALESMSPEEVISSGFARRLTPIEIQTVADLRALGIQSVPKLLADYNRINKWAREPKVIKFFKSQGWDPRQATEFIMDAAGLSPNAREAIRLIRSRVSESNPDVFSPFAVSRLFHAGVSRGQFMKDNNFSVIEREIVNRMEELFNAAFVESGIDPKRFIQGYFPHMREMAQYGNIPNDFALELPVETTFFARKFRQGETDLYSKDPLRMAFRYISLMYRDRYLNPLVPDARKFLRQLAGTDERAYRVAAQYMNDIFGRPHSQFRTLANMTNKVFELFGIQVSPFATQRFVNSVIGLGHRAFIPFRPWMLGRQLFMTMAVGGRVDLDALVHGIRVGPTKEGFNFTVQGGGIIHTPNRIPVAFNDEVWGPLGQRLGELGAGPLRLGKAGDMLETMTDKGFLFYQGADDVVRSIAHNAMWRQIGKAESRLVKGEINFDQFLQESRISQFHPVDQQQFAQMWNLGQKEQAKHYLAATLAREVAGRWGFANSAHGWSSVMGRFFGQFGSFGVQFKDYLVNGVTYGTPAQKAKFAAWMSTMMGSPVVLAKGLWGTDYDGTGYNFDKWSPAYSLFFNGGPYFHVGSDIMAYLGGTEREQAVSGYNLMQWVPFYQSDASSPLIPLSGALADVKYTYDDVNDENYADALMRALFGVRAE